MKQNNKLSNLSTNLLDKPVCIFDKKRSRYFVEEKSGFV